MKRLLLPLLVLLAVVSTATAADQYGAAAWRQLKFLLTDLTCSAPGTCDLAAGTTIGGAAIGGGGAPTTLDYLVGTATGSLSAEIVAGTAPGGELGGTWASPTIDSGVVSFAELVAGAAADAQVDGTLEENEIDLLDLLDTAAADTCAASEIVRRNAGDTAFECAAGGSGEVNTGSNLGGGLANYSTKVAADLQFNSFAAADFDLATNLLTIDATKWLTITAADAAYQPLNANLTSIAALTTTAFGRGLLTEVSDTTLRTTLALVPGTNVQVFDADLLSIAGLVTTTGGQSILATTPADDQVYVGDTASAGTWRSVPDCGESGTLNYTAASNTFSCLTDSGGSGGSVEVSLAITSDGSYFSTTVTGQTWVAAGSEIVCTPFGTTADSLTPEAVTIGALDFTVSDKVVGTGFNLNVWSPNGLEGTVRAHCIGV